MSAFDYDFNCVGDAYASVIAAATLVKCEGLVPDGTEDKIVKMISESFGRIRGNRPEGFKVSYADLKLVLLAGIRQALKILEEDE